MVFFNEKLFKPFSHLKFFLKKYFGKKIITKGLNTGKKYFLKDIIYMVSLCVRVCKMKHYTIQLDS